MLYLHKSAAMILVLGALTCIVRPVNSQDNDLIVGKKSASSTAAVFDLSDPNDLNIEVSLWGFVKYPGRYKVPYKTTFLDLISFSGGPTEESNLEDIRIFRRGNDSLLTKNQIIKLNYNDLLWDEKINSSGKMNPTLKSGDIVIVLHESRYTLREDIGFYLPIITSLITIATFIITISRQ
jgi:hypothetical protein